MKLDGLTIEQIEERIRALQPRELARLLFSLVTVEQCMTPKEIAARRRLPYRAVLEAIERRELRPVQRQGKGYAVPVSAVADWAGRMES